MSWFYQSIQEKVAGSQLFMQLKAARPKIYQVVMCIRHGKTYARSLDGQVTKKEMKMRIVSKKPRKDKTSPIQKKMFK